MTLKRRSERGISAIGTLIAFILFLVFLGILWASTGGPERPISHAGPFLKPPSAPSVQLGIGQVQGSTFEAESTQIEDVERDTETLLTRFFNAGSSQSGSTQTDSPYAKDIVVSRANSYASDPNAEYILIETSASSARTITITGWTLESRATGIRAQIGGAAPIPLLGGVSTELPISLAPQSRVYITTGRSPIGSSFRLSTCTGFFEQYQNFDPELERSCPNPRDELFSHPEKAGNNSACIDFIDRVRSCELYTSDIPYDVGTQCRSFIQNDLTYNGCVALHRNDTDFTRNEWRIFLNRQQELWNNTHDQIRLYDESGKLVSVVTY